MRRILFIKQDTALKKRLAETLTSGGYAVDSVVDGSHGIKKIGEETFDLIICDTDMPGVCGFGLLSLARFFSENTSAPFIFLSGVADSENKRKALQLGADDYLVKPVEPTDLLNAVKETITDTGRKRRPEGQDSYVSELENLIHLMSHSLRGPVCTNLGLVNLLEEGKKYSLTDRELQMVIEGMKATAKELDLKTQEFTTKMQALLEIRQQYLRIYRSRQLCPRLKLRPD